VSYLFQEDLGSRIGINLGNGHVLLELHLGKFDTLLGISSGLAIMHGSSQIHAQTSGAQNVLATRKRVFGLINTSRDRSRVSQQVS